MTVPIEERFWAKVDQNGPVPAHRPDLGPCWLWTGSKSKTGYGQLARTKWKEGPIRAHSFAWMLMRGPITQGLELDHLCHVRACVNPQHLELVTHRENLLRGTGFVAQQARRTHCPRGHPYDSENTRIYGNKRYCRACYG